MSTSKSILFLEDDPGIADTLAYLLDQNGYQATHASSLAAARDALESSKFDLLLLDITLPDGSGLDLCREVRATSTVPIIFLTAKTEEIDRVLGLELGGDDYITKPFSTRELLARIKAMFRRLPNAQAGESEATQVYGALSVIPERYQVFYQDVALPLSRYEYGILNFLLRRPGNVYSRAQIMESVWEDPDMSLERTIDAHVKAIRRKIKEVGGDGNLIQTHRGIGYSVNIDD